MPRAMPITFVIPAYQPDLQLVALAQGLSDREIPLVVVDDGSAPGCAAIFDAVQRMAGVTVLRHAVNLGKGAALKTAFNHVLVHDPESPGV